MVSRSTSTVLDDLATSERTSTVDEPTVAANSKMVLVTGNWYATRSTDRGKTWTPVDPFAAFPMIGGNFCCDQLVWNSKRHRRWLWILQYDNGLANGRERTATGDLKDERARFVDIVGLLADRRRPDTDRTMVRLP